MKISPCRLADYVKNLHQKACRTCSKCMTEIRGKSVLVRVSKGTDYRDKVGWLTAAFTPYMLMPLRYDDSSGQRYHMSRPLCARVRGNTVSTRSNFAVARVKKVKKKRSKCAIKKMITT